MEQQTEASENYFATTRTAIEEYIFARWQLLKVQLTDKSAKVLSLIWIALAGISFLIFIVFAISMLLGYWFSYMTDSNTIGFAILTGIYFVKIVILWMARHAVVRAIANIGIKAIFSNKDKDKRDAEKRN